MPGTMQDCDPLAVASSLGTNYQYQAQRLCQLVVKLRFQVGIRTKHARTWCRYSHLAGRSSHEQPSTLVCSPTPASE